MKNRLPLRSHIVHAWESAYGYEPPWGEVVDWGEPQCWACHYYAESWPDGSLAAWDKAHGLDRCHVVPRALGGSDDSLNLVLMCERCHEDSPDCSDQSYLFTWMKKRPKRFMGTWLPIQSAELQRLCSMAIARNLCQETLMADVRQFARDSGSHFGWTSDGTREALLIHLAKKIEEADDRARAR